VGGLALAIGERQLAGFPAVGMLRHVCRRGAALWLGWPLCG
jgi:hypothetical protein